MSDRLFERLSLPGGGTLLLVTPPAGRLADVFGDAVGLGAFEDAGTPAEECRLRYRRLSLALAPKRIQVLSMPDHGTVLDAFTAAVDEADSIRANAERPA
jgi:hypothetical protein